jgi:hypothetical protein
VIPDRAGSFPTPPPTAGTPPSAPHTLSFDSYKVSLRHVQTETQQTQRKNRHLGAATAPSRVRSQEPSGCAVFERSAQTHGVAEMRGSTSLLASAKIAEWNSWQYVFRDRQWTRLTRSHSLGSTSASSDGNSFVERVHEPASRQPNGSAMLRSPTGDMKIEVQWEPNYRPPVWQSVAGEQLMMIHLDVGVADLEAGVNWAVAQGARLANHQPQDDVRVMLDPEGHPSASSQTIRFDP